MSASKPKPQEITETHVPDEKGETVGPNPSLLDDERFGGGKQDTQKVSDQSSERKNL
jgi:hypothetical protein